MTISIIIPVYNTSQFLPECLESVLNQTYKDIEIICVNDGSTDNSLEILKDYPVKTINQEHKGPAAARNKGLENATGEYVLFLDSDDYLTNNALEKLYNIAESKNLDLLLFKLIDFNNETREKSKYAYFEMNLLKNTVQDNVFNFKDIKELLFRISVTAPGKLYKRDLIKDIRFNEGLIFEDNPFFIELFLNTKQAYFHDEYLYLRRLHGNSITNSNFNKFSDVIPIYNIINNIIQEYGVYEDVKHKLFNRQCRDIYLRFSQVPDEFKNDFFKKIKQDFSDKKSVYEKDGTLELANKRSKEIFFNAIDSKTYTEFELAIEIFDLKRELKKIKKENKKRVKQINNKPKKSLKKLFKL